MTTSIQAIDGASIHKITSGQVVVDLQTAVKELVENSLDAGATNIEIRLKHYGLRSVEVVDNGRGIPEKDHENIALKHCTSKLSSYDDLAAIQTFGFRGEALSSLCALSESVTVTTSTKAPMGVMLEMAPSGKVKKRSMTARQQGTTVSLVNLFSPLPVRRKEFERNLKREFGKAMSLLTSYALVPCAGRHDQTTPVRLSVSNHIDSGSKSVQLRTHGSSSTRAAVAALWGNKTLDNLVDLELTFEVEKDKNAVKRLASLSDEAATVDTTSVSVAVNGLISKFSPNHGRSGTDRQFFYINGRPCTLAKVQKVINEVYRSFNATQSPFIVADFIVPTDTYDVNVSPDKRTIFLHNESNLMTALRVALEETFSPSRSTFDLNSSQHRVSKSHPTSPVTPTAGRKTSFARSSSRDVTENEIPPEEPEADDFMTVSASNAVSIEDAEVPPSVPPPNIVSPVTPQRPSLTGADSAQTYASSSNTSSSSPQSATATADEMQEPPFVVLDTTQAIWSQGTSGSSHRDKTREDRDEEGPPRKKRRSEAAEPVLVQRKIADMFGQQASCKAPAVTFMEDISDDAMDIDAPPCKERPSVPRNSSRSGTSTSRRLGSRLRSFAMPGSQQTTEEDDGEDDGDHEGEVGGSCHTPLAAPTSPDLDAEPSETGDPSSNTSTGAESQDIVDLTGDDLFEDNIPTLTDADVSTPRSSSDPITRPEVIRSTDSDGSDVTLRVDLSHITNVWHNIQTRLSAAPANALLRTSPSNGTPIVDASVSNIQDEARAIKALTRVIEKADFGKMEVLGQFNLGFIIVRRQKRIDHEKDAEVGAGLMDDLFIVDQHAADEKYNFEQLQETTKIKSQRLLRPMDLELTASDELVAFENMDILRNNGFELCVAPETAELGCCDDDDDDTEASRKRLQLIAQPVSKDTTFGVKDLEELIHLLHDHASGQMVRCSKVRAMFAMRACRKSIMVGMPLTKKQMTTVVQHMGTMDLPWNCPHGRPTMRHLHDISQSNSIQKMSLRTRAIDWTQLDRI